MGFWSSVSSGIRSVGSAIVSGARAVASGIGRGISAVASAGGRLFKSAASAVKQMASKVHDWKALLNAMVDGAKKGAKIGAKKGPWGMLFGGLIGAGIGGWLEWKKQAASHQHMPEPIYEEEERGEVDTDIERLGKMITEFLPALQRKFSSNAPVESFEEYLRIDVSMAFIRDFLNRLEKMESVSELTVSDRRFIELIDKLALDKPMSETELQEFDDLVKQRFGKSLLLIGSQRLFSLWTNEEETCKQNVNQQRTEISRAEIYYKELESRVKYDLPMTEEEKAKYEELKMHVTKTRQEYENSRKYLANIRLMTGVAEGLLQQAEADNAGQIIREQERKRADRAGAILVNMERNLDESNQEQALPLANEDKNFLEQYVDLHMPAAIKRQKQHAQEFVEVNV
ncbi:hypothetical protein ACG9HX_15460 [Acinetobacter ursingii]|uniref:Uncharacterized protein n=1 Tax=Acinetobacter ursingii TaxID=108980 RepID=A0AA46N9V8_9GAMM|nr:hypothetical protein [Acinetobacter ursingii]UYF70943.1 hypothetical protein LSO60_11815 [Acinetobacter ursingii]